MPSKMLPLGQITACSMGESVSVEAVASLITMFFNVTAKTKMLKLRFSLQVPLGQCRRRQTYSRHLRKSVKPPKKFPRISAPGKKGAKEKNFKSVDKDSDGTLRMGRFSLNQY